MEFLDKLGKVLMKNIVYTVVLAVAVILFLYFAGGDLIAGALTAGSAVVAYHMIVLLYFEYKKTSKDTKPAVRCLLHFMPKRLGRRMCSS